MNDKKKYLFKYVHAVGIINDIAHQKTNNFIKT